MEETELTNRALALLDRAVIDQDKAERGSAKLYHPSERWDFVRGARQVLRLAVLAAESRRDEPETPEGRAREIAF